MGTWFDKYVPPFPSVRNMITFTDLCICRDFDEHGPAGPTCFWKYSDGFGLCKARPASES